MSVMWVTSVDIGDPHLIMGLRHAGCISTKTVFSHGGNETGMMVSRFVWFVILVLRLEY